MFVNLSFAAAFVRLFEKGKLTVKNILSRIQVNMAFMKKQSKLVMKPPLTTMPYTANQIADWFLAKLDTNAGDTISPLKLQKLVYYAQAWHLAVFHQALFEEPIQAWAHGPVVPSVYQRFKDNCRYCIIDVNIAGLDIVEFPANTESLLHEIYAIYGEHSASYLEQLAHSEIPWIKARNGLPLYQRSDEIITIDSMIAYYNNLKNEKKTS